MSTWEKPDGFVSSSNENSKRGKRSEEGAETGSKASESDSSEEDSESEAQSPGKKSKVNSLFRFILHIVFTF